jgi:hypothetical protein
MLVSLNMNKCYHYNFVSIFNSDRGCAYCPDCGKAPLSVNECGTIILKPGFDKLAESIAKDIINDILSNPPSTYDDLPGNINMLIDLIQSYPYLRRDKVFEWIEQAHKLMY